jgi:hypothetical protein
VGTCLLCKKDHVGNLRRHVSAFHPEQTAEAHRHVETGHPNRHNANFWISSVFLGLTIVLPSAFSTVEPEGDYFKFWFGGAVAFLLLLPASLMLSLSGRYPQTRNGMLLALLFGATALLTTCVVNLSNFDPCSTGGCVFPG